MSCYHPNIGIFRGFYPSGKPWYTPIGLRPRTEYLLNDPNNIIMSCGQCTGCRLDYSAEWANRMMCELDTIPFDERQNCYFVTLTYDDFHLPFVSYHDPESDCCLSLPSLDKDAVSAFMKRLRKRFGSGIRFFACGEYSKIGRPHYHLIIYNLPLDRNNPDHYRFYKYEMLDKIRVDYFRSDLLERIWAESSYSGGKGQRAYTRYGMVVLAEVNWHTCAYTARYVTKKLTGRRATEYSDFGLVPPFSLQSRRPGIGRIYFDLHKDFLAESMNISLATPEGGKTFRTPRYYEKVFENIEGTSLYDKELRKNLARSKTYKRLMENPGKSLFDLLCEDEKQFKLRAAAVLARHKNL